MSKLPLLHLATAFLPIVLMLVGIKLLEAIVSRFTHRRKGISGSEVRDTAIAALRSLGHSKASAEGKVDASIKALGRKATVEQVIREAIRRSVAKQLEA